MNASLLLLVLIATSAAYADSNDEQRQAERRAATERRFALEQRIAATKPQRRNHPLRYENISDEEAREVKSVVQKILPRAIVNIGPVVTGCPCEEGPECTDQVWITVDHGESSSGLLLSRTARAWTIGPIQRWWFEKGDLEKRRSSLRYSDYYAAEDALIDRFPACSSELIEPVKRKRE